MKIKNTFYHIVVLFFATLGANLSFADNHTLIDHTIESSKTIYPACPINRPGIMPVGLIEIDSAATLSNSKNLGIGFYSEFGIAKNLMGKFAYDGFLLNNFKTPDYAKSFLLGIKYKFHSWSFASSSVEIDIPLFIRQHIIREATLGFPLSFYNNHMAGGLFKKLLTIIVRDSVAGSVDFPIWYGVQTVQNLWVKLDTSFGGVSLVNDRNQARVEHHWLWQKPELKLSALYGFNSMFDLGAYIGNNNLRDFKNNINAGITFNIRAGSIINS